MQAKLEDWVITMALSFIGVLIGVGRLLANDADFSWRKYVGHAVITSGLSVGAGAILLLIPDAPVLAVLGLASIFASVGVVTFERLATRYAEKQLGIDSDDNDE